MVSKSLEETKAVAKDFLSKITPSPERATIVALSGDLGSGKTAFVKCAAEILGIKEDVTSPTFVILKKYVLTNMKYDNLIHIDAYRLKSGEELKKIRFSEFVSDRKNIIFVEWPENVPEVIPKDSYKISFKFIDEKLAR